MPVATLYTSAEIPSPPERDALLRDVSSALARLLGKPEAYVMTCLAPRSTMTFAGSTDPACLVEVKSIGALTPQSTARLSEALCKRIHEGLGVPTNRIYAVFTDVSAHLWGFDGSTFGM